MSETTTTDTALMELEQFQLPDTVAEMEFSSEELAEDMEGMQITFTRVKMPSGGAVVFEMPTENPDKPIYVETLRGIIVHHHNANAYWPDGESEDESVPPACSSNNGKVAVGIPGGLCDDCGLNEFNSGENGKGKACKNKRHIYLLRSGDYLPILLQLPPTSLNPYNKFYSQSFASRHRVSYGSIVEIGLKRMDNGNLFSVATFRVIGDFSGPMLAAVKAYAEAFKEQIKPLLKQSSAESVMEPLAYADYTAAPAALGAAPSQFDALEDLPFGPPSQPQLAEDLPFGPEPAAMAGAALQEVEDLPFGPAPEAPAAGPPLQVAAVAVHDGNVQGLPA